MNKNRIFIGVSLIIALLYGLTVWWDPYLPARHSGPLVMLNVLPVLLVAMLLLGLTGRLASTVVLVVAFLAWVFFVNFMKLATLNQPAVFGDFLLIYQTVRGFDLLGKYGSPLLFFLVIGAVIAGALYLFWRERPVLTLRQGLGLALVSGLLLWSIGQQQWPLGALYRAAPVTAQDWDPVNNVQINGVIASLARASSRVRYDFDAPLTTSTARPEVMAQHAITTLISPPARPDILVVLNESFFDPGILDGIDDCELLPAWCALRDQGQSGTLAVPTYGGNTTRSEFELLTAIPISSFDGLDYAYLSVVTRPLRSLVWMLRDQGYVTAALHNHDTHFWNRSTAFPRLGFQSFLGVEALSEREHLGYYANDESLNAPLGAWLDRSDDAPPGFLFVITMENHGPWNERRRLRLPDTVADYRVPEAAAQIPGGPLQQYLFHADRSMAQMQALWERIQSRERDTLLVMFGDHLPGLGPTFDAIGFDDGNPPYTQHTLYLMLANYELPGTLLNHLPIHQLLPQALHAAGLALDEGYGELAASWEVAQEAQDQNAMDNYREQLIWQLLRSDTQTPSP